MPKAQELTYGALVKGRVTIIEEAAEYAKKALVIAVRYSAIRRQFPSAANASVEEKVLAGLQNASSHRLTK